MYASYKNLFIGIVSAPNSVKGTTFDYILSNYQLKGYVNSFYLVKFFFYYFF